MDAPDSKGGSNQELRQQIERQLLSALDRAKARYERAKAEDEHGLAVFLDSEPGSADGHFALGTGAAADANARHQYAQALREFTRFVARGEVPERLKRIVDGALRMRHTSKDRGRSG